MRKGSLVQVKFWDEETLRLHIYNDKLLKKDIDDLKDYKKVMVEKVKDKVYLVFVEEINQELFNEAVRKLMEPLGEDASSWFKPVNGYMRLER